MSNFENILTPRRKEFSNIAWAIRSMNTSYPCNHTIKTTPYTLKENVLKCDRIQTVLRKLSEENCIALEDLEEQVRIILDEIGFNHDYFLLRFLAIFLAKINCKIYKGIYINADHIRKLKEDMGSSPIIYMPNHRSYADFITMSYILFTMDIAIPAVAAGMDFHSMWGMGTMMRHTGAFFMRRSYNNDNLYWDTFREYVHQIITTVDCGIEFYIEGMRSRSSKSLPPKFGLLFMILKAFFTGEVPDILFLPIGISYDRVLEEKLFGFELLGVPKPKETTTGFFKSFKILRENFGNIHFNFGKPISAKEFFGSKLSRLKHSMKPLCMQELFPEEKTEIVQLAEHIVQSQQDLVIITTFNLISVILTNSLMKKENIMRLNELIMEVMWLNGLLKSLGAQTDIQNPRRNVEDALEVHDYLVRVDEDSNIKLLQNRIVLGNYDPKKLKGHSLSEKTMTLSVPFIMLQIYVNPTMHYFANYAILVSIFRSLNVDQISKDKLHEEYLFLRTLFSNEFTLFDYKCKEDYTKSIEVILELDVLYKLNDDHYTYGKNTKVRELLLNLLEPFLYSYYIVCTVLSERQQIAFPEKMIMAAAQEELEKLINNQSDFIHPYSLSLDTISNCLQSLVKLEALKKYRQNDTNVYDINLNILVVLIKRLGKITGSSVVTCLNEQMVTEQKVGWNVDYDFRKE